MKRSITLILAIIMAALSLNACVKGGENIDTPTTYVPSAAPITDAPEPPEADSKYPVLDEPLNVPLIDLYINVPSEFKVQHDAATSIISIPEEKYIALTTAKYSEATELMDAHEDAMEYFEMGVQNTSLIYDIVIDNDDILTVNGIEVYKYEGTLLQGSDRVEQEQYLVGYSFIFDGVPCNLTGVVLDESQSDELKAEVKYLVDEIMKTVRSEP